MRILPVLASSRLSERADSSLPCFANGYECETLEDGSERNVFHVHPFLAPYKAGILPLTKKQNEKAQELYGMLIKEFDCEYDETGNIGKRYRRHDEIGTPFCVTVDFDTETDNCVTVRERDSMQQVRVPIAEVAEYIKKRIQL
jgi:glycyl-tRNA synthetase